MRHCAKEDVQRLKERKKLRRDPTKLTKLTAEALHSGTPFLYSAISLIDDGRPYYRRHHVADVAGLIWIADLEVGRRSLFPTSVLTLSKIVRTLVRRAQVLPSFERFQAVLPFIAVG